MGSITNMNLTALHSWWARPLLVVGNNTLTVGKVVGGVAFVLAIWWLASWLERLLQALGQRRFQDPRTHARLHMFSRLLRYAVWLVGTLMGLNYLGIDLSNVALLGSALAVGLGFGLQNVVSNFVSGLILLFEQSLKVGDFVDLESGVRGHVREIAMRYTRVTTNDRIDVLVPNSQFINGRVINWTHDDSLTRIHVPFGVAYGSDKQRVREAGLAAARAVEGVMDTGAHAPEVWLVAYGDSSMNYELVVWVQRELTINPAKTQARMLWALDDELAKRQLEIPFPQRDLNVRSGVLDVRVHR